jgi:hypothetical protein
MPFTIAREEASTIQASLNRRLRSRNERKKNTEELVAD